MRVQTFNPQTAQNETAHCACLWFTPCLCVGAGGARPCTHARPRAHPLGASSVCTLQARHVIFCHRVSRAELALGGVWAIVSPSWRPGPSESNFGSGGAIHNGFRWDERFVRVEVPSGSICEHQSKLMYTVLHGFTSARFHTMTQ